MEKPELLLPAGNIECLRAAVANGADAVYLGLKSFNARRKAGNFTENNLKSVVKYCHDHNVKVYVTLNILIKNHELEQAMNLVNVVFESKADALIIQDLGLIPLIKKDYPSLSIHLSTQATVTNSQMIPEKVDRVILARELKLGQIKKISEKYETEVFVHGALCISYSGQCLFSSIVGGRSGNRGLCAQPCRKKYNNSYLLSTKDLCLLKKLPEIIKSGVKSLKVEGRMRSSIYVATVAKIYRKYIDQLENWKGVEESDVNLLKIIFSREFTNGFMFEDSIVDSRMPMNRGLFIGKVRDSLVKLKHSISVGDGIAFRIEDESSGKVLEKINVDGKGLQKKAEVGDIIDFGNLKEGTEVYKTSQADLIVDLGEDIELEEKEIPKKDFNFNFQNKQFSDQKIIVKTYNLKSAIEADKFGCDIIYYDFMKKDFSELQKKLKNADLFGETPNIVFDEDISKIVELVKEKKPAGILIGNRGLLDIFVKEGYKIHLNNSLNIFNDMDIDYYSKFSNVIPIISPELSLGELKELKNKKFISQIHGRMRVMTLKEKLKAPELIDESGRHFEVVSKENCTEIINSKELGLFNKIKDLQDIGIKYFLIDTKKDPDKFVRIYKKILSGEKFDDTKIKKGYTTGHFGKSVL